MRLFTNTAPPTRLAGALTDSATTITVDSTDDWPSPTGGDVALGCLSYPTAGLLELFTYTGKTSTTFTGVVRGVDDTDPKAHLNRALVVHVASWTDIGGGGGGGATNAVDLVVDDALFTVLTGTDAQTVLDSVDDAIEELDTDLTALDGSVASGTESQSPVGVTNVATITAVGATRYQRIGDVVFAAGKVSVDPTTAGVLTEFTIALPIAEAIVNDNQGSGMAVSDRAGEPAAYARSDATTDAMFFSVTPTSGSVHLYSYQFSYVIV